MPQNFRERGTLSGKNTKQRRIHRDSKAFAILILIVVLFLYTPWEFGHVERLSIDIALIFTQDLTQDATQVIKSYYAYNSHDAVFHLITDAKSYAFEDLNVSSNFKFQTYKLATSRAGNLLAGYLHDKTANQFDLIKLALHEILSCDKVLYLDIDTTIVSDISECYFRGFHPGSLISLAIDMGDACQEEPDKCWPLAQIWEVDKTSQCINYLSSNMPAKCIHTKIRSFQYNFGVALMDLNGMRRKGFTLMLIRSVIENGQIVGHKKANYGGQDFVNSMVLQYPEIVQVLPCGCNYQTAGVIRTVACPNQKIKIAHLWSSTLKSEANEADPFVVHFRHFSGTGVNLKPLPLHSPSLTAHSRLPIPFHDPLCSTQSYHCQTAKTSSYFSALEPVHIVTRTKGRPDFFKENYYSVKSQKHPFVTHWAVTTSVASRSYIQEYKDLETIFLPELDNLTPADICSSCGHLSSKCPQAPMDLGRQEFLECFCSLGYPANKILINALRQKGLQGWVLILDDDNMMVSDDALSRLLLRTKSRRSLVIFRSYLGRITPSDANFGRIVRGDIDMTNFFFHSSMLKHVDLRIGAEKRCFDYFLVSELAKVTTHHEWLKEELVVSHPYRPVLGGLGKAVLSFPKLTIVMTGYDERRMHLLQRTIESYCNGPAAGYIDRIILVWNNPGIIFPENHNAKLKLLRMGQNRLNNRWIETIDHIRTDAVLVLDDDLMVRKEAIVCLMTAFMQNSERIIGPFARPVRNQKYVIEEVTTGPYHIIIGRCMMLHKKFFRMYKDIRQNNNSLFQTDIGCDDITVNYMAYATTKKLPLQVKLPSRSVIDYYISMYESGQGEKIGGLALAGGWNNVRHRCIEMAENHFGLVIPEAKDKFECTICGKPAISPGSPAEYNDVIQKARI
ncbi:hypothetical protein M9434_001293 [Picochlorum sp. BPE23]|nr:hypothetical protein M9434_001293 [Picochlorum sp. BPE23]